MRVLEAGGGVGGTWYWNRYPGARCDIESVDYSYSFSDELQQEWTWSERYPAQPEILRYLEHVADRFDLRRDIQLDTRVTEAALRRGRAAAGTIDTEAASSFSAPYCVMAAGCLSALKRPDIPGPRRLRGRVVPHRALAARAASTSPASASASIGTGSTGIQAIPTIAEQAEHLYVFQRTPNYSLPAQQPAARPADEAEAIKATLRRAPAPGARVVHRRARRTLADVGAVEVDRRGAGAGVRDALAAGRAQSS